MSQYKIIFTGPVGAGKTTAIASISDVEPFSTDKLSTDMTAKRKAKTTVAMDYGYMKLDSGETIHLYGTPGQERFNFMWDILTDGGIGLVLLVDNTRKDPFADLKFFLDAFSGFIDDTAVVIGVTQVDVCARPSITDYHQFFKDSPMNPAIFTVDARERQDVSTLVQALLYTLDPVMAG
jgi:signal recognition particle receptor subunit beta